MGLFFTGSNEARGLTEYGAENLLKVPVEGRENENMRVGASLVGVAQSGGRENHERRAQGWYPSYKVFS